MPLYELAYCALPLTALALRGSMDHFAFEMAVMVAYSLAQVLLPGVLAVKVACEVALLGVAAAFALKARPGRGLYALTSACGIVFTAAFAPHVALFVVAIVMALAHAALYLAVTLNQTSVRWRPLASATFLIAMAASSVLCWMLDEQGDAYSGYAQQPLSLASLAFAVWRCPRRHRAAASMRKTAPDSVSSASFPLAVRASPPALAFASLQSGAEGSSQTIVNEDSEGSDAEEANTHTKLAK